MSIIYSFYGKVGVSYLYKKLDKISTILSSLPNFRIPNLFLLTMDYSFGNWVNRRRKALDLTQQELAQRVGCSLAIIVKIESDERRPSRQDASAECGNTKQQGSQKIHGVGYLPKHWEDTQVNLAGDARKHPREA